MESRSDTRTELNSLEKRIQALSEPSPPRPSATIAEALAGEKVPVGVWRKSRECQKIRSSSYFQKACAAVLGLRAELAAAKDYERFNQRARELREILATTPTMATSDPLPQAFSATVGHVVPLDGTVGIALLLAAVTEIFSCFGLAFLRVLKNGKPPAPSAVVRDDPMRDGEDCNEHTELIARPVLGTTHNGALPADSPIPRSSLKTVAVGSRQGNRPHHKDGGGAPSNVISLRKDNRTTKVEREAKRSSAPASPDNLSSPASNVPAFVRNRLRSAAGASISASEIHAAYQHWCASQGQEPRSQQKLGVDLAGLGLSKWKSCGRIHYRDVQLAA